ncbi:ATP/GTP-binding protein [Streptomyces sp. NPDC004609]|uniref:GTP-binding protein n=1 Tax=Streptomyces sp. NPDC004609 TaxID=3364704 RepID=UPI0036AA1225
MSAYKPSDGPPQESGQPAAEVKIVIAGGFGAGKTSLVGALSEIEPLTTEGVLTAAGAATDDLDGLGHKTTTTVAMDFGRITFRKPRPMVLFLFGTPGQPRFWFTWTDLSQGAIGAVVLADTRRLQDSFPAVGFFEQRGTPFVVAVNQFDNSHRYTPDEVRHALGLPPEVPVLTCDARDRQSALNVVITLVRHAITTLKTPPGALT